MELGMRICTKMIWLEGMLPSQFSLWQNELHHSFTGWPFHGERGCLEVVRRKKRLNEAEKGKNRLPSPVRPFGGMHSDSFHSLLIY